MKFLLLYQSDISSHCSIRTEATSVLSIRVSRSCCRSVTWKWTLARKWEWRWTGRGWTFLIALATDWISTIRPTAWSSARRSGSRSSGTVSAFSRCPHLRRTGVGCAASAVISIPRSRTTSLRDAVGRCKTCSSSANPGRWALRRYAIEHQDSEIWIGRSAAEEERTTGSLPHYY